MTGNEIIKDLEDYIKENEFEYFHSNIMGEYSLIRKSLDFINLQESEIERLQKEVNLVSIQFQDIQERQEESQAEIERLKGSTIVNNIMESQRIKREAKSEAYKEFAERLKEKAQIADCFDSYNMVVGTHFIDNLLKEMVGE